MSDLTPNALGQVWTNNDLVTYPTTIIKGTNIMNSKVTVYTAHMSNGKLGHETINIGDTLPKGCYWTKEEALSAGYEIQKLRFAEYKKHKPAANEILDKLECDIKELLKKSGCGLDFSHNGDLCGIYDDSIVLSATVDGCIYTKRVEF